MNSRRCIFGLIFEEPTTIGGLAVAVPAIFGTGIKFTAR
jgi:hypothetical protein